MNYIVIFVITGIFFTIIVGIFWGIIYDSNSSRKNISKIIIIILFSFIIGFSIGGLFTIDFLEKII